MKIILFGAPGAGKGTLAGHIKKLLPNIVHISTGDLFRYNIRENTKIGIKAKQYIENGQLVPDEVVIDMVKDRFSQQDVKKHGFLLDGFPRTLNQAQKLAEITEIDMVLVIDVPRDELFKRILGRISCPKCNTIYNKFFKPPKVEDKCDKCGAQLSHRSDDTEDTLKVRLDTYERNAEPVLEYYKKKGIIRDVDGRRTMYLSKKQVKSMINVRKKPNNLQLL